MRRLVAHVAALALGLAALTGCGGSSGPVTLTVFAASSLTDVMAEMAAVYQQTHRRVRIRPVVAGSQRLVEKLRNRDPADVLITADETTMRDAARYASDSRIVAHNSMTIAVEPGNPRRILGLADLARPGVRVVLGAPTVPVGRYARQILARAAVTVHSASEEIDARSVLTRVRTGEADAGIVYITDLRSAGAAASSVPIPADMNVTAAYPAGVVKRGGHGEAAGAFVDWLTTPAARTIFGKHGFVVP